MDEKMNLEIRYIWQNPNWTEWEIEQAVLSETLSQVYYQQGLLKGRLLHLGLFEQEELSLQCLTESVVKTSEIEGEVLNPFSVRSSLARRLGMDIGALSPMDRTVEGMVEMTLDAAENHASPLTLERLYGWHAALFPTGYSGMFKINTAQLRDDKEGEMQVVSGRLGRQKVHFQAPPAERLETEMDHFLAWLNQDNLNDLFIKAGIAHLWFLTLHPFEDGNGRIARAIADKLLAQADQSPLRFYSLSAQIERKRAEYYTVLEQTQKGEISITEWLNWFLACVAEAMQQVHHTLDQVLRKNRYWQQWQAFALNERQIKVLNLFLGDFEGKLTNKKWAAITKVSRDTALRDITDLIEKGILVKSNAGGRNVSYELMPLG